MSNDSVLLTIAIPTYNRVNYLRSLVDSLVTQISKLKFGADRMAILISDNVSTDGTEEYLSSLAKLDYVTVHRQSENFGSTPNVIFCFREAKSRYVWLLGDDDLPLPGSLQLVLDHLTSVEPALFFLPPKWIRGKLDGFSVAGCESGNVQRVDRKMLSLKASVYTTFISSWIVDRAEFINRYGDAGIDQHKHTSFPQLAWIYGLMMTDLPFLASAKTCLLATAGNSGSYGLFDVFGEQYAKITQSSFPLKGWMRDFHLNNMLWNFIPALVWESRASTAGNFGKFDAQKVEKILLPVYGDNRFFRIVVLPMIRNKSKSVHCYWMLARALRKLRNSLLGTRLVVDRIVSQA